MTLSPAAVVAEADLERWVVEGAEPVGVEDQQLGQPVVRADDLQARPLYDSTFSRTVWRLYGGAKDLVVWYYLQAGQVRVPKRQPGRGH
jgi:hypothetical protein